MFRDAPDGSREGNFVSAAECVRTLHTRHKVGASRPTGSSAAIGRHPEAITGASCQRRTSSKE